MLIALRQKRRVRMPDVRPVTWSPGHLVTLSCFLLAGCQQQMAQQPHYRPLQPSDYFADGRSARPLVPGTVARGQLRQGAFLLTGRNPGVTEANQTSAADPAREYVTAFPYPVTEDVLLRGRQRFTIFCAVCHDPLGTGRGKIVERGYTPPPNFHTDLSRGLAIRGAKVLLREVPVGYIFDVITNGFGAMPDYNSQIPPHDRWAIVAYVRTLQISQNVQLADLPEAERRAAREALEGTP
jgi:mono/diheme cytochrome c family protein